MDTTRSLHLFSAWCFERWVSKSVCPWSDVFFTSGSETDFISIFCHTVGTDEECDHCLSLFGRAMLPFVFSFTAFFKNFLFYFMLLHFDAEQLPSYVFIQLFLIFILAITTHRMPNILTSVRHTKRHLNYLLYSDCPENAADSADLFTVKYHSPSGDLPVQAAQRFFPRAAVVLFSNTLFDKARNWNWVASIQGCTCLTCNFSKSIVALEF